MATPLPTVLCCGLSCLDVELCNTNVPSNREAVVPFSGTKLRAGGSSPQTATALAAVNVCVAMMTAVGCDENGRILDGLCESVPVRHLVQVEPLAATAVAYLPVFTDGTRGCFVDLGANLSANASLFAPLIRKFPELRVFHFGYPHLMPKLQGDALHQLFLTVHADCPAARITLDINGVSVSESKQRVLAPACELVAAVHANADEALLLAAVDSVREALDYFTQTLRVAAVLITCGKSGAFAATGTQFRKRTRCSLAENQQCYRAAFELTKRSNVNASGAGDSFCAGIAAHLATCEANDDGDLLSLVDAGLASAAFRLDPSIVGDDSAVTMSKLSKSLQGARRIIPAEPYAALAHSLRDNHGICSEDDNGTITEHVAAIPKNFATPTRKLYSILRAEESDQSWLTLHREKKTRPTLVLLPSSQQ